MKQKLNKTIYIGVGCFWGGQAYFDLTDGIVATEVGYANGNDEITGTTYEVVCSGKYKFAEIVKVTFDTSIITFDEVLTHFFSIINPYLLNQQGNDVGIQYRTALYLENDLDLEIAHKFVKAKQESTDRKIVIDVALLKNYFKAEKEHQKYLKNNPGGYCHITLPKKK